MDEADAGPDGGREVPDETRTGADGDPPTWAALFERAAAYDIGEATVREALDRHREER